MKYDCNRATLRFAATEKPSLGIFTTTMTNIFAQDFLHVSLLPPFSPAEKKEMEDRAGEQGKEEAEWGVSCRGRGRPLFSPLPLLRPQTKQRPSPLPSFPKSERTTGPGRDQDQNLLPILRVRVRGGGESERKPTPPPTPLFLSPSAAS